MKRRCFVFLMAFLFVSAWIVAAEPSGLETENILCGIKEIIEDSAAFFPSAAEQAEAVLIEPSDGGISGDEISPFDVLGESAEEARDSAVVGLPRELDEDIRASSLEDKLPANLTIGIGEASDENRFDLDSEPETGDDPIGMSSTAAELGGVQEDQAQTEGGVVELPDSQMPDGTEPCQTEYLHPADVISAADLKISSSLDPIRLIRLPDGCRVEGEILFTVVVQNMSLQNLRVRAMPVFSEKAQALYMELGISLDQDAIEITVDGGGEQSLIWRFTAIAGKTAGFDPSLINAQDLVFQLRVAVEAVMP